MVDSKVPMVVKRLAEVMKSLPGLEKTKKAPKEAGGFAYRGIDDLLDTLHPLLVNCKLNLSPRVLPEFSKIHFHGDRMSRIAEVYVEYEFQSTEDGSVKVIGPVLGTGADNMDKMAGKAMTSAFKNAMYQAFCVAVGDGSIDPEIDSQPEGLPQQQARPAVAGSDKDGQHRHELEDIATKLAGTDKDMFTGYIRDWTSWDTKDKEGKPVTRYCTKASDTYPSGDFVLQGTRLNIAIANARKSLANFEASGTNTITPEEQEQIDSMLGSAPPEVEGE